MQRHWLWCGLLWIAVVCGFAESAQAHALGRIMIGWGEELTDVGELPPPVAAETAEELGHSVKVAFLYSRAHFCWLDVWTWNGRHVLRSGDRYWDVRPEGWQLMLGEQPAKLYSTPLRYRFPILPVGLGLLLAGGWVKERFFKAEQQQLALMFNGSWCGKVVATLLADRRPARADTGRHRP